MRVICAALILGLAGLVVPLEADACEMNVREAGFLNNAGGPYQSRPYMLWMFCEKMTDEVKEYSKGVYEMLSKELEGANLSLDVIEREKVAPEDQKTLTEMKVDLKELPVTVLARQAGYEFQVLLVEKRRIEKEEIRAIFSTPKRLAMKKLLSDNSNYNIFVFVPGTDKKASDAALKVVTDTIAEHHKTQPTQKMPILTIDRNDKMEALLIKELMIKPEDTEPVAAVIFGKGRLLLPPFKGEEIAKDKLLRHFSYLNHNASDCTVDAVDIPEATADLLLAWPFNLDEKVILEIARSGVVADLDVSWWTDAEVDPETGELIDKSKKEDAPKQPAHDHDQEPVSDKTEPGIQVAEVSPEPAGQSTIAPKLSDGSETKNVEPSKGPMPAWTYSLPVVAGVLGVLLLVGWVVVFKKQKD